MFGSYPVFGPYADAVTIVVAIVSLFMIAFAVLIAAFRLRRGAHEREAAALLGPVDGGAR
jgi:hypothetical protein